MTPGPSLPLDIRPAEPSEAELASSIMNEAARWLLEHGAPASMVWTPEQLAPERLAPVIAAGELHLAHLAGEAVGTLILQWEDAFLWPDVPAGESAFVHRLAVRRAHAGRGLGRAMLGWAAERARDRERRYLRLDCAPRPGLCAFYEAAGFHRHSERQVGRFHIVRYERDLVAPAHRAPPHPEP